MHLLRTLASALVLTSALQAQVASGRVYTAADYAQAERFMNYSTAPLVFHTVTEPQWLPDGRVWYRDKGPNGTTFTLADPAHATKAPAFDQAKLALALNAANPGAPAIDPQHLPIETFAFSDHDHTVDLTLYGNRHYLCDLSATTCKSISPNSLTVPVDVSPDGKQAAFLRDWNLWVQDLTTGKETQLTTDGVPNYGYATDNAGWTHSDKPILVWSPDSKRIATFQQDQRKTGELYLTHITTTHPELAVLKNPLPGDKDVTMIERVVIDLGATPKLTRLKLPPDQHRSSLCDDISCRGGSGWDDVQWSADSKSLAFVSTSRNHQQEWVRLANPDTGDVREVMNETVATFFESGNGKVNWHYLSKSNELLWFSERDNWGQLYLYDMATGAFKHPITRGDGNVTQVLSVDEDSRTIYFVAVGKRAGDDPYYQLLYSINFEGSALKLLTPEPADHTVTLSPDHRFFVDTYSTTTQPQLTVLRDSSGKIVEALAHQDVSRLVATGWQPPVPIMVKARDHQTDLYGMLFRPTNFSTDAKYPIVDLVYPGPQQGSCGAPNGSRSFAASHRDMQSLAELGFIVVCIDGLGTPGRSKSFHATSYGNMSDYTIPDQVAGIQELAARYPWIDLNRVGVWGHSGGGAAAGAAMFRFPDFFKVGISESGNHDNRMYEDDWGEKYQGLLVQKADGTDNYDAQANQTYAKNLKGHLLLMHGTADDNVPPANTLLVVDALIKANKDFDLVMIPNARHGYTTASQYAMRRRWDYFVRYLAGGTPPHEYTMKPYADTQRILNGPDGDGDPDQ